MKKMKFEVEFSPRDLALPLHIDFDCYITGPFFLIHILCFKFCWHDGYDEEE